MQHLDNGIMVSKHELMEALASKVQICRKCPLWMTRKQAVLGDGDINTSVLFIGEAPGYWEDVKGRPFVGAAGKLFDERLSDIGLRRRDVYVTNVIKCRPPDNRDPLQLEINACAPYLTQQIKIVAPKLLVTLGRHATACVFREADLEFGGITKVHGRVYNSSILGLDMLLFPMFHPAAALYNPRYRDAIEADFQLLESRLQSP